MGAKTDPKTFAKTADLLTAFPDAPTQGASVYYDRMQKSAQYIAWYNNFQDGYRIGVGSQIPMKDGSTFEVETIWDASMVLKAMTIVFGWDSKDIDKATVDIASYGVIGGGTITVAPSTSTPTATVMKTPAMKPDSTGRPYVPAMESYYDQPIKVDGLKVNATLLDTIQLALEYDWPTIYVGLKGCGKTTGLIHAAAKRGRCFRRIQLTPGTTTDTLIGHHELKAREIRDENGKVIGAAPETPWVDGDVIDAMRHGDILCLDELNMCQPDILSVLRPLLDGSKSITLHDHNGEIVHAHPDFRIFATMNPPEDPNYVGTSELNDADLSRFTQIIYVDYLPPAVEVDCVMDKAGVQVRQLVEKAVEFANLVRAKYGISAGGVNSTLATRDLIEWMKVARAKDTHTAYALAVERRLKAEDRDAVKLMFKAIFK